MVASVLLLLLISEFSSRIAGQEGNSSIPLGSSLSPTGRSYWSSPSGQFNFGFYPYGNGYAVAIWFNRISQVILTSDGKLIVQPNQGENIAIVGRVLILRQTPFHSAGKFQLLMQTDGNLVRYPTDVAKPETAYWNATTYLARNNVSLNLDVNGKLYLLNGTSFNIMNLYGGNSSSTATYRLTIDSDGIFRLYLHSSDPNGDWKVEWSSTTNTCVPKGLWRNEV